MYFAKKPAYSTRLAVYSKDSCAPFKTLGSVADSLRLFFFWGGTLLPWKSQFPEVLIMIMIYYIVIPK